MAKQDNTLDFFEEDAVENADVGDLNDAKLSKLSQLVKDMQVLQDEITNLEATLKEKQTAFNLINQNQIPQYMRDELGFEKIVLKDGTTLTIKDEVQVSISQEHQGLAFAWFRKSGFGDLIKNEIKTRLPMGSDKKAKQIENFIKKMGLQPEVKESIHPMTLKAFVKEQLERGTTLPETVSIFPYAKTVIKAKKER